MQASGFADGAVVGPCGSGFRLNCGLITFRYGYFGQYGVLPSGGESRSLPSRPTRTGETRYLIRRGLIIILIAE